jgi:hypothetical protein
MAVYERIQRFVIGLYYIHNGIIKNPNPSNWNLILTIVILRNLPNQINDFSRYDDHLIWCSSF